MSSTKQPLLLLVHGYDELGWETLSDRRMVRRILQIHKIVNNKTPSYLKDNLPPNRRPFLFNVFREITFTTDRYRNSFFPSAIASWNIIISHFEDLPSFDSLKSLFYLFFDPRLKVYLVYTILYVLDICSN